MLCKVCGHRLASQEPSDVDCGTALSSAAATEDSLPQGKRGQQKTRCRISVTTKAELQALIAKTMAESGVNCDLNFIDVSKLTDLSGLFHSDEYAELSNFQGDISGWDVSQVKDMSCMFDGCKSFNGDLSKWNVSQVKGMSCMFDGCESFNGDLSRWNVSQVKDMRRMFWGCTSFNGDLSRWNVSQVKNLSDMFLGCKSFNGDLSKWNVSQVKDMRRMFLGCTSFNRDLSRWNVSNVKRFNGIFHGCSFALKDCTAGWDLSQAVDITCADDLFKSREESYVV